jgi:hypothetical protein
VNKPNDLLFNLEEDETHFYLCFIAAGVNLNGIEFLVEPLKSSWTIKLKRSGAKLGARLIGTGEIAVGETSERTGILPNSVNATVAPTIECQDGWLIVTLTKYSQSQTVVMGVPLVRS